MTDPWLTQEKGNENLENGHDTDNENNTKKSEFEDNFTSSETSSQHDPNNAHHINSNNSNEHRPLPDSASYLQGLERKLEKLKKGSKLVEALAEKRQDCLRALLDDRQSSFESPSNESLFDLDAPIGNVDSAVQGIYRHLQPIQAVTIGETVHIVKYDQLEEQQKEEESLEEEADSPDK